jgi:hypothetical protein
MLAVFIAGKLLLKKCLPASKINGLSAIVKHNFVIFKPQAGKEKFCHAAQFALGKDVC